jgi:hypothetical protein
VNEAGLDDGSFGKVQAGDASTSYKYLSYQNGLTSSNWIGNHEF